MVSEITKKLSKDETWKFDCKFTDWDFFLLDRWTFENVRLRFFETELKPDMQIQIVSMVCFEGIIFQRLDQIER